MSVSNDAQEYRKLREWVLALSETLFGNSIGFYSAILHVKSLDTLDKPVDSARFDLSEIRNCSLFILLYPQKTASSVLVELGYALALKKRTLILCPTKHELPFMLQEIDKAVSNVNIRTGPINVDNTRDDVMKWILKYDHN